jgi:phosphatidylinositol alpha-1,6-mannosyltransferase
MVSSSFLPGRGGIESYLDELCEELAPHLAAYAPATREGISIPADLPYPAAGFPGSMLVPTTRVARAIEEEAQRRSVDRVLFGTPWPLVLLAPSLREAGLSYSVIVHGAEFVSPSIVPGVKKRLARALSEADLLFTVSEFTRSKVSTFLEREDRRVPPIDLLRARVDLDRFHPKRADPEMKRRLGLREDQPFVLCFGRLVPRKGIDRLLNAAGDISKRVPGAAFVIAGTGPEEKKLHRLGARSGARVIFTGRVSEEEAPVLYATADAFALPVTDRWLGLDIEGLGVVLLEAAAAGTACVSGRSGGTPEALVDRETGFLIDARDPASLVDRISTLLRDPELATRMGAAGRSFVAEHFSNRPLPDSLLEWLDIEQPSERDAGHSAVSEEDGWN